MTPIISPWFIYLLSVIPAINACVMFIATALGVCALVGVVGYGIVALDPSDFDDGEGWLRFLKKMKKATLVPAIIFITLAIAIPSRKTIIAMYVTNFVTTDNVVKAIEVGGQFKDVVKKDIIDIIEAMKGQVEEVKKSEN